MPLFADGLKKIRRNLIQVQSGEKPRAVRIGFSTQEQIVQINNARNSMGFQALRPEILFHGSHLYNSRCVENGSTINQVLEQILSAFSDASVVDSSQPSLVLYNPNNRMDHERTLVSDRVVFECTGRHPYAELYSVVPKGDGRMKRRKVKGSLEE